MGTNTQVNKQDNLCSVETSQSDVMESHKSLGSCPRAVPMLVGQTTQPTGSFHFPGTGAGGGGCKLRGSALCSEDLDWVEAGKTS